jgi:UDP-GlcNAc:undecaprenyl-phosphate GlcNAc-1-phosphate transferase
MRYAGAFITSLVLALYLTPLMRKAALQLGIVDTPDGQLKTHDNATPYLGGLAVFTAFLFTVGVFTDFGHETLGLLLSGCIALVVGPAR